MTMIWEWPKWTSGTCLAFIIARLDWFIDANSEIFGGFMEGKGCGGDAASTLPEVRTREGCVLKPGPLGQ